MPFFTINFKGPLAALQGPRIDGEPQALPIPTVSMVTGIIGSALGLSRRDCSRLQALQDSIHLACVVHRRGVEVLDYQTADLSKPHLAGPMWSSGRSIVIREGSAEAVTGTRQQWRPYLADFDMTLVVQIDGDSPYAPQQILSALSEPARPLFLGRTSCPPEVALSGSVIEATSLEDATEFVARWRRPDLVYLPADRTRTKWGDLPVSIPGRRDWIADRHSGSDLYVCRQLPAMERSG